MPASIDHRIAAIAASQHGLATRDQLRALGLSNGAIAGRIRSGRLHRIHRCVYAIGHAALSRSARWMAAVLAGGDGAVLDGRAAAELHGIERPSWRHRRTPIDVLVTRNRRPDTGIRFRRTTNLATEHVTIVDGIPVVTVARLLVSLSTSETATTVCKLIDEAAFHDALDLDAVRAVATELRSHPAGSTIGEALDLYLEGDHGTDSELEELGLEFCRASGVPDPACNRYIVTSGGERFRADQVWVDRRLIQEVNGTGHARPTRRRADRRRQRAFRTDGWRYLVVTRHHLVDPVARERAGRRLRTAWNNGSPRRDHGVNTT